MTLRLRFADAGDVFSTFPGLTAYAAKPLGALAPLDHARALAGSRRPFEALIFLAHVLARREAIWWGFQCIAATSPTRDDAMRLAERWVREPDDAVRREALALSETQPPLSPSTWLARAVGHSGGSLAAPDQPLTAPAPDACALAVNAAIVLSTTAQPPALIHPLMRALADAGIRFAEGQDLRIAVPPTPR